MLGLQDKVCAVVGGANGIGRATVEALRRYGAFVYVVDMDAAAAESTCREIDPAGTKTRPLRADIGNLDDIMELRQSIEGHLGVLDVLVNIAAGVAFETVSNDFAKWDYIMRHSVSAYAVLSGHMIELMQHRRSSIINMSSVSALVAQPGFGTYAASKSAVYALTRCMALDLMRFRIRVNCICPGTVWTSANARHIGQQHGVDRAGADKHPEIGGRHILQRCADPWEIAEPIAFLASDSSSFMTGHALVVDGGYTVI